MEKENWNHLAFHVKIIEMNAGSPHFIQAYTDGSKREEGVGAVIEIYQDNNLTSTLEVRLSERCTKNQAELIAILKALEHLQFMETGDKIKPYTHGQPNISSITTKQEKTHKTYRTNKNKNK